MIENSIVLQPMEFEMVDYRKLKPFQKSLKQMPNTLYDKLKQSFVTKGIFAPFFVWKDKKNDYFILDGHGREKVLQNENIVLSSNKGNIYDVPCVVLYAENEEDAKEKLLIINSKYQEYDDITDFINGIDQDFIDDVVNIPEISDLADDVEFDQDDDQIEDTEIGMIGDVYQLNDMVVFERGLNKYDIPKLKSDKITTIPEPIQVYCGDGRTIDTDYPGFWLFIKGCYHEKVDCTNGILSFYGWDDKFEAAWSNTIEYTEKIQKKQYLAAITPNFTIIDGEPRAWQIWQTYRNRWVGRFFQEAGLLIIPDITWTNSDSYEFAFLGIEKGVSCVSIQTQNINLSDAVNKAMVEDGMAEMIKRLEPQSIFIYGSPNNKTYITSLIPVGLKYIWCDTWISQRRGKMNKL